MKKPYWFLNTRKAKLKRFFRQWIITKERKWHLKMLSFHYLYDKNTNTQLYDTKPYIQELVKKERKLFFFWVWEAISLNHDKWYKTDQEKQIDIDKIYIELFSKYKHWEKKKNKIVYSNVKNKPQHWSIIHIGCEINKLILTFINFKHGSCQKITTKPWDRHQEIDFYKQYLGQIVCVCGEYCFLHHQEICKKPYKTEVKWMLGLIGTQIFFSVVVGTLTLLLMKGIM